MEKKVDLKMLTLGEEEEVQQIQIMLDWCVFRNRSFRRVVIG